MDSRQYSPEKIQSVIESFGPNAGLVEELMQDFLINPAAVSPSWQAYFRMQLNGGEAEVQQEQVQAISPAAVQKPAEGTVPAGLPVTALRGVAAKIVENMEASLSLPTATSIRTMPVKILDENRRLLNQHLPGRNSPKISYTHVIAYAIVRALQQSPGMNASFARIGGLPHRTDRTAINIGLAIDLRRKDGSRSLSVPNVKNAGEMDFAAFLKAYNDIVQRARSGALDPGDFQDTSITLTNPGTVGTVASIPRLMPGQGAIIATGAIGYPAETQGMSDETLATLGMS